ncbi:MAG: hypothetical protein GTO12_15655 [Proteobacteria bacterium]|nr:hypothetical protein [Pseudomonadota bacterium]
MNKFGRKLVLVVFLIMASVLVVGCSSRFVPQQGEGANPSSSVSSVSRPTNGLVQTDAGGSVTIDVEWDKTGDGSLSFNVSMNTHSVDLDQYDLGKLAILRDDAGNEYRPVSWDSAFGGHHRRGTLAFPVPDSLDQQEAKYVEMVIRDVAGVKERVLRWEL